jgi:hypothetical protein
MKIRTIKRHDPDFSISDGYLVTGRASIEINQECPAHIAYQIQQAISYGWVNVQAHVPEPELVWENLSK